MLITEEEAKTKWCPESVARVYEAPINRARDGEERYVEPYTRCLASGCMAWRWWDGPRLTNLSRDDNDDAHTQQQGRQEYEPGQRRGYCGKFERPE